MTGASEDIQGEIEEFLAAQGIASKDGLFGPKCQTGEEYIELIIRGGGVATLAIAAAGAVGAFGKPGSTCYWRIKADYENHPDRVEGVYVRFLVTDKPELAADGLR